MVLGRVEGLANKGQRQRPCAQMAQDTFLAILYYNTKQSNIKNPIHQESQHSYIHYVTWCLVSCSLCSHNLHLWCFSVATRSAPKACVRWCLLLDTYKRNACKHARKLKIRIKSRKYDGQPGNYMVLGWVEGPANEGQRQRPCAQMAQDTFSNFIL